MDITPIRLQLNNRYPSYQLYAVAGAPGSDPETVLKVCLLHTYKWLRARFGAFKLRELETPEPDILADIAASLKEQVDSFTVDKANASNLTSDAVNGMDKLSKIISFSDVQVGHEILEAIKQKDKSVLEPLYPIGVTFDDLAELDTNSIKTIFDAANPNELALALVDTKKDLLDKFLIALPEPERRMYRGQLWLLGPTKLSDVEESRKRIVRLAMDLAVQGKVKLPSRFYADPLKIRA